MNSSVVYAKHCLNQHERTVAEFRGMSIADLDPEWERPYIAMVDGEAVLRKDWSLTVLETGHVLIFVDVEAIPQGGSNPLQAVMVIAVIALSIYTGGIAGVAYGAGWGAAAQAGVMMAGTMLVNALVPAQTQSLSNNAITQAASPTYSLQAQGNTVRLEAAIPEQFGRHMSYPDFAALPYQEFAGNEQYLYTLLCLGRGAYDVEGIFIEDTPIGSFEGVSTEVIPPGSHVTLFPTNVITSAEVVGQDLITDTWYGPFIAAPAGTVTNALAIDISAPKGLFLIDDAGDMRTVGVNYTIEYQLIDDDGYAIGGWTALAQPYITGATTTPQRYSGRYSVNPGRYQVRVKRTDAKDTSIKAGHDLNWVGLRAYLVGYDTFGDVTLIAIRMKATSQLSGFSSRKIKVISTRKLPVWNGSAWVGPYATKSIAWAFAYACKQIGIPDSRIDLAALLTIDSIWSSRGDECNGRVDSFMSFWDALTKISGAGRAKPYMQSGIVRVFRDQSASIPVALFSMRNILKSSFSVDYLMPTAETANAVDVGYFDADVWAPRRVLAVTAGSEGDKPAKSESSFVTNRNQAWREGIYSAACNKYRRKIIKFSAEMEGFIPSFGDLIVVQHDMPAWGQSSEIVYWDGNPNTATIKVSEELQWDTRYVHYVGIRRPDGSMLGPIAAAMGATSSDLILQSPLDFNLYTGQEHERTQIVFGWAETWGQRARVLSVKPKGMYSVEIECVNEDSNVHTAEIGVTVPTAPVSQLPGVTTSPDLAGLTAVIVPADSSTVMLSWQPAPWADHYIVEVSADSVTWSRVGETRVSNYSVRAIYGTGTVFRVAAVGIAQGNWSTIAYVDIPATTWAPELSGFQIAANGTVIDLSWNPASDWNIAGYELRVGSSWDTGTVIVTGLMASKHSWQPTTSGTLTLWLKAIDRYGIYSATSASAVFSVNAPTVTGLAAQVIDNNVLLYWGSVQGSFSIAQYEIRKGEAYEGSALIGTINGTFTSIFETASGTYKYWVTAIDASGLYGTPVSTQAVVSQPPDYVLFDRRPLGLAGAMTNAVIDQGSLYGPVNDTETYQDHFSREGAISPEYQATTLGLPYFLQATMATGSYVEVIDYGVTVPATRVSLSVTTETVVGTVTITPTISVSLDGSTWVDNAGSWETYGTQFRYAKITLDFATSNNGYVKITDSLVRLDVKLKTIQGENAVSSADSGGTSVDITGKFVDVQSIVLTPKGTTACFAIYDFVDTANPTSFKILLFNTTGTRMSGTVSWSIRGV